MTLSLMLAVCAVLGGSSPVQASGTAMSSTDASIGGVKQQLHFQAGTGGYGCCRILALGRTKEGSLLAFAEGRKAPSCRDQGDTDFVVRRSTNDGRTWGPISVVRAVAQPSGRGRPAPCRLGSTPDRRYGVPTRSR